MTVRDAGRNTTEKASGRVASVTFAGVDKTYPDGTRAVKELSLAIEDGEFIVFVGPSGCGKTTALRMVAGLEEITGGQLLIGDAVVNDVEPRLRDVSMVFQNYALYPHMTVFDNIAFPSPAQRVPKKTIRERVEQTAKMLALDEHLKRRPGNLSGGQRQRVAMGRAIIRQPQVFLMDEPLSNLDAKLRVQMRAELAPPAGARGHDDLRDPRPGRGDDDGRSDRRDAKGHSPAAGRAAGAVRRAYKPFRRDIRRLAGDESVPGKRRRVERRDRDRPGQPTPRAPVIRAGADRGVSRPARRRRNPARAHVRAVT